MGNHAERCAPEHAARWLWSRKYPSASAVFCGGSVVRGEGYASSDLDVVVVFDSVPAAWRESFVFEGWPVEVFAHDPETLVYFVEADCKQGRPALAHMLAHAIVLPELTAWSERIQTWARDILATPPTAQPEALHAERYAITDLLNDFRDDRPRAERVAIACALHPLVFNFALRAHGQWLGSGKTLPALMKEAAPDVAQALVSGFEAFFQHDDRVGVIRAVERVLAPFGGELFAGFRADAPRDHRSTARDAAAIAARVPR